MSSSIVRYLCTYGTLLLLAIISGAAGCTTGQPPTPSRCSALAADIDPIDLLDATGISKLGTLPPIVYVLGKEDRAELSKLLKTGADPNACFAGFSVLMFAAGIGDGDLVTLLLESGADVDQPLDQQGQTALFYAFTGSHYAIANQLTVARADTRIVDDAKQSTLHVVSFISPPSSSSERRSQLQWAQRLMDEGISVNSTTEWGATPLIYATAVGNGPLVKLLLDQGGDPALTSQRGENAIEIARKKGFADIAQDLVQRTQTTRP